MTLVSLIFFLDKRHEITVPQRSISSGVHPVELMDHSGMVCRERKRETAWKVHLEIWCDLSAVSLKVRKYL